MVINIGWLKNKQYDDVRNDIAPSRLLWATRC